LGIYRRRITLEAAITLLENGQKRAMDLLSVLNARVLGEFELKQVDPKLDTLKNLNTPVDYTDALRLAGFI
jgi:hypothetical protein